MARVKAGRLRVRNAGSPVETLANLDGPGVMVFEDVDSPSVAATFGEVMCSTYKAAGAAGIITSGAFRSLHSARAIRA